MATESIDDFLEKVDEIHKQVTGLAKNEISLDDLEVKQKKLEDDLKRKEETKRRKEEEEREKIRKGRPGKGESKDYVSFCRFCFVEYTIETPNCVHCGKKTMSNQERQDELKLKLNDFKKKKVAKEERKNKWEKWRKTQAMYWKKTSTNYSKWDYFTSSESEDENPEPILPKNDPNFAAMEKDLEERMKRREADKKVALEMKAQGNDYLAKRDYLKAIECYTIGMEKVKDMKELYTNRALAYLKLGNYEKVIKDCTNMLEFIEVFEKGYEQSAPLCFKALVRRAQAYKESNKVDEAIQDIEQALKLSPKDKDAIRMKAEFQLAKEIQEKSKTFKDVQNPEESDKKEEKVEKEEKNGELDSAAEGSQDKKEVQVVAEPVAAASKVNLNDAKACKQVIDDFIQQETPSKDLMDSLINVFKQNSDYKVYANDKQIAKKLVSLIKREDVDRIIYLLIIVFIQDNAIYIDQFFKNMGPHTLMKKLKEKAETAEKSEDKTKKSDSFQDIEEICEVFLNITENDKGRVLLKDFQYLNDFLDSFYPLIMSNIRNEKEAATSYFGLLSNLSVVSTKFAKYLETNYLDKMIEPLVEKVFKKTKTSKYNRMKENLYGLIANLLREDSVRVKFLNITSAIESFYKSTLQSLDSFAILNPANLKWIKSVDNILAIFINLTFGITEDIKKRIFVEKLQLLEHLRRFMTLSTKKNEYIQIILRVLQIISRFGFEESFVNGHKDVITNSFTEHFDQRAKDLEITNHAIRLYTRWISRENATPIRKYFTTTDIEPLIKNLLIIIKETNEERFVNSAMLIGNVAEVYPECASRFKECIPLLLDVCKDKTGVWRKNAAICVAKLSKNPENLQKIRDLHGIEVLSSISKFILEK